mmetsp:Transcript_26096/g.43103  ORF Transcript_26096/g.43103 Transcript_26096/m.43103 type:complete len:651 (+) Transcript_26096:6-1958(+)
MVVFTHSLALSLAIPATHGLQLPLPRTVSIVSRCGVPSPSMTLDDDKLARLQAALAALKTDGYDPEALKPLEQQIGELSRLGDLSQPSGEISAAASLPSVPGLPQLFSWATQAIPDAGQARLPLSPDRPDPRAKVPGARELPPCTVVVAGANGRVGSKVVTELLRKHSKVRVRALVRSVDRIEGYEKLSFEVGAEDGRMDIRAAWEWREQGGLLQGQRSEFDTATQGSYGLDRLEVLECELRYRPDVAKALAGADCVIYCATTFDEGRTRLPERFDNFNRAAAALGADLFEFRLPGFGRQRDDESAARSESSAGKTADEDGVRIVLEELKRELARRSRIAQLTGGSSADALSGSVWPVPTPFVLASSSAALAYDDANALVGQAELQETEFGYRKRMAEAAARASGMMSVIIRPAMLDELRVEEGLQVESQAGVVAEALVGKAEGGADPAGVKDDQLRKNRIHPRDVARVLVACLFGVEGATGGVEDPAYTFEIWTEKFDKQALGISPSALFSADPDAVRQKWRANNLAPAEAVGRREKNKQQEAEAKAVEERERNEVAEKYRKVSSALMQLVSRATKSLKVDTSRYEYGGRSRRAELTEENTACANALKSVIEDAMLIGVDRAAVADAQDTLKRLEDQAAKRKEIDQGNK